MIIDEYFDIKIHKERCLPLILKKLAGESEPDHIERVRRYLLAADDKKFLDIANLIDPEN